MARPIGAEGNDMEPTEWPFGNVILRFEPPDLLHCHVHGPVTVSDIDETVRVMRDEVIPGCHDFYFIVHTGELGTEAMPMETRKHFATVKPLWKATVMIGGTKIMRLAANVFMHAATVLSSNKIPMRVVKDEKEAISFINELRARSARPA